MSFGFSVGDFVAVVILARDLYKDIYKVARHAPEEVQILGKEIAILAESIDLLIAEIKDPDSILVRAGEDRVALTNNIIDRTKITLSSLQKILLRYDVREKPGDLRGKLRFAWDRVKFAADYASIDELRTKLQYHNGTINLLLTSVGNSSLQQVERSNAKIQSDIEGIRQLLKAQSPNPSDATLISLSDDGHVINAELSATFLRNAEIFQPWLWTSFEEWVQVGKWWLLKAQRELSSTSAPTEKFSTQAYVDLLKTAWVVSDVLSKHPQSKFGSSSNAYKRIEDLTEVSHLYPRWILIQL
jgi:hypothetical protein